MIQQLVTLTTLIWLSHQPYKVSTIIIPIAYMEKLRLGRGWHFPEVIFQRSHS